MNKNIKKEIIVKLCCILTNYIIRKIGRRMAKDKIYDLFQKTYERGKIDGVEGLSKEIFNLDSFDTIIDVKTITQNFINQLKKEKE